MDSTIQVQMADAGIMGVAAAIFVDRQVVWSKGYGYADVRRTRPFTTRTVMNVASITKPFIGVTMMRAVREGKVSLDRDINHYLPFRVVNPHRPLDTVTLRDIATHTSGITDRWEVYRDTYHYNGSRPEPLATFLPAYFVPGGAYYARDNFLNVAPGAERDYCNICAALAAHVLERAYGESFSQLTRRMILTPLGMRSSGWSLREIDRTRHSTLFASQDGNPIPVQLYESTTYPDGGLRTTVDDLSRFFEMMLNGGAARGARILDPSDVAEMTRFQFTSARHPANFPESEGNSGLFWRTRLNGVRVGHGGNDPGVSTEMLANRAGDVGVILFMNTSVTGSGQRNAQAISDALWVWAQALRSSGGAGAKPPS